MDKLELDYKPWVASDVYPEVSESIAVAAACVLGGIYVADINTHKYYSRDPLASKALDQAVLLLAMIVEWLRYNKIPEAEVRSRVKAVLSRLRNSKQVRVEKSGAVARAQDEIADPLNRKHRLDPEKPVSTR